ncbi:hypothetical protein [Qipengyuania sp. ASV99]|uniref:hypothetical protein n=1 Tax=Qipengyuania sp. ASV99 TaxID=3399681 RepID=UPI003A4C5C63
MRAENGFLGGLLRFAALIFAAAILAAGPAAAQADDSQIELSEKRGKFTFSGWDGPEITVWTYVPEGIDRTAAPIVMVMHGVNRDGWRYRDEWIDNAKQGGFIVVAPEFSNGNFPRAAGYNLGAMFDEETGAPRPEALWSYSAIEPIFDEIVARLGGSQTHYTLYGHSAGSQFVHRFLFMKPETRARRYIAANAGWYTFADPAIAFPFGLGGTAATEEGLRLALAKDVLVLLGDQDTDPNHRSLNRSEGAMQQGPHRFARGVAFYEAARAYAAQRGWEFGWQIRRVPGVAHSNSGMAAGAVALIE